MNFFNSLISSNLYFWISSFISFRLIFFINRNFFILEAICLNIIVGTASPILCLIFNSSFFEIFCFSDKGKAFKSVKSFGSHLKEFGIVMIFINSLIEKTLSSIG